MAKIQKRVKLDFFFFKKSKGRTGRVNAQSTLVARVRFRIQCVEHGLK